MVFNEEEVQGDSPNGGPKPKTPIKRPDPTSNQPSKLLSNSLHYKPGCRLPDK